LVTSVKSHSLSILWVRRNHCREVAIYNHLLRNYIDVLEAPRTQAERYDDTTCTMHSRVNDIEVKDPSFKCAGCYNRCTAAAMDKIEAIKKSLNLD
jgi:hypothetical protein